MNDVPWSKMYCKFNGLLSRKHIKLPTATLDIVGCLLVLMKQPTKGRKVSENDYLDMVWLLILQALSAINHNITRSKKGETVPEESTADNSQIFLHDYEDDQFDIGVAEACISDADAIKVIDECCQAPSLNFRHLLLSFTVTMKHPSPDKLKRNFVITATQTKSLKLGYALVGLEISKWNDLDSLAKHAMKLQRKNLPIDASLSLDCYKSTLSKIAQNYTNKYDALRSFARKLNAYLKNAPVVTAYHQKFNALKLQDEGKKEKTQMMAIAQVNATKAASVAGLELKRKFDKTTNDEPSSMDEANLNHEAGIVNEADIDHEAGIVAEADDQTSMVAMSYSEIKCRIFKRAEQLQKKYIQGAKITPDERKLLSCGSSLILDLIDQSPGTCFRECFTQDEWCVIVKHFEAKLKLSGVALQKALLDKWEYAAGLSLLSNSLEEAQLYLQSMYCKFYGRLSRKHIKLLTAILDVVERNSLLIKQPAKTRKCSENDYLDMVWLPVFQALFATNNNIIRPKKGETVPEESTAEKNQMYAVSTNIIGFKTDIRFLYDHEDDQFDLGAVEACLPDADDSKVTDECYQNDK
ncbi:hypothetical protein MBANPS3_011893 [Mucor bainieri]